jgi:hypothetical protein
LPVLLAAAPRVKAALGLLSAMRGLGSLARFTKVLMNFVPFLYYFIKIVTCQFSHNFVRYNFWRLADKYQIQNKMVKYGSYLLATRKPDWVEYYIEYNNLKKLIKESVKVNKPLRKEFFLLLDKSLDNVVDFYVEELERIVRVIMKYNDRDFIAS